MSVKITRVIACDGTGCRIMSLDLLQAIEREKKPDLEGWKEVPVEGEEFAEFPRPKHLCPACVASGNQIEPPPEPIDDDNEELPPIQYPKPKKG
jgi:hypothetical protein